jgi:hypothetical protein
MTNNIERRLHILVADYLARSLPLEILWTTFPAGENRTAATGALLKRMGLQPGWPDFILVLPGGYAAFIELKALDGSLSKAQRDHERAAQALGARWAECRSLEEVQAVLEMWGVQLRARI